MINILNDVYFFLLIASIILIGIYAISLLVIREKVSYISYIKIQTVLLIILWFVLLAMLIIRILKGDSNIEIQINAVIFLIVTVFLFYYMHKIDKFYELKEKEDNNINM